METLRSQAEKLQNSINFYFLLNQLIHRLNSKNNSANVVRQVTVNIRNDRTSGPLTRLKTLYITFDTSTFIMQAT